MEPFILKKKPFEHFTISAWEGIIPSLSAGFSTKQGGMSKGDYQSMNLALHVNDDEHNVMTNRRTLTAAIDFPFDAWTSGEQVHGNHIEIIRTEQRGKGRLSRLDALSDTDGLLTNEVGILLTSYYADCVPLYFLDPENRVIGLAHAGWKGTVLKIAEKMVKMMEKEFHSNIKKIKVAIGPAIDQCCYEVDDKVINRINDEIKKIPKGAILDKGNGHYDLDLKKINKQIVIDAGILTENIEISLLCTSCSTDLFYSHRRDNGKTGRMASWIGLRKDE